MYMDGFNWLGTTCAIYLFPNWILDTAGKLWGACLGSMVFGALMEYVIGQRRTVVPNLPEGYPRLAVSALFYGLQLTMGYSLMLVVMVYSVPLFFSVIVGLVTGHVLFTAKDALVDTTTTTSSKSEKSTASAETGRLECDCEERPLPSKATATYSSCCDPASEAEESDVPEGSTPCCQHI